MILKDKHYKFLKWFVMIALPALTAFVGTVGITLGWENTDVVATLMVAFTTLLGALVKVSDINYKEGEEK